jgi:hypothetical protein
MDTCNNPRLLDCLSRHIDSLQIPSSSSQLTNGLFIYSAKTCLRGKTPPRLGHLAPASEVALKREWSCQFWNGKLSPPATSEAGARWPKTWRRLPAKTRLRRVDEQANSINWVEDMQCFGVYKTEDLFCNDAPGLEDTLSTELKTW